MIKLVKQFLGLESKVAEVATEEPVSPSFEAYNKQRDNQPHTTFCHAPSVNMYFDRRGHVVACCHNRTYVLGNYPENSIAEIWNGEKAESLRKAMRENNLSLGCLVCSLDFHRASYPEIKANHFDQLERHGSYPTMMEFELDNTCNLECTMCSGEFSTSIRKNREKLPIIPTPYDDAFVEQLKEFLPYLKEARFSGGEPFLVPKYYDIWEELTRVNPDCLISVQTNGTVLNNKVKDIIEKGRFEIGISLDSITAETFETIRKNAKYDRVREHIDYFSEYCKRKDTAFRLSMCVMRNNWWEMTEYVELCNGLNAYASFHQVYSPKEQSIFILPKDELVAIYDQLRNVDLPEETTIQQRNKEHYFNYLKVVKERAGDTSNDIAYTDEYLTEENIAALLQEYVKTASDYVYEWEVIPPDEKSQKVAHCEKILKRIFEFSREKGILQMTLAKLERVPIAQLMHHLYMDDAVVEDTLVRFSEGEFG